MLTVTSANAQAINLGKLFLSSPGGFRLSSASTQHNSASSSSQHNSTTSQHHHSPNVSYISSSTKTHRDNNNTSRQTQSPSLRVHTTRTWTNAPALRIRLAAESRGPRPAKPLPAKIAVSRPKESCATPESASLRVFGGARPCAAPLPTSL